MKPILITRICISTQRIFLLCRSLFCFIFSLARTCQWRRYDDPLSFTALSSCPSGNLTGIISERDYITKLALLGKKSKDTAVKEVMTTAANLITGSPNDTVDACMDKMLSRSIRHLPLVDKASGKVVGLLSIKDIIKVLVEEKDAEIKQLSKLALGQDEVV